MPSIRQAADDARSRQPTHHGYAVNVKDNALYESHEPLSDDEAQGIWDAVAEGFWMDAECIAQNHGFQTVYSEGRMGGWCVPQPQPATDDMWPDDIEAWLEERFRPFERDILDAMQQAQELAAADIAEAVDKAKREPAERAYWEARDVPTVER